MISPVALTLAPSKWTEDTSFRATKHCAVSSFVDRSVGETETMMSKFCQSPLYHMAGPSKRNLGVVHAGCAGVDEAHRVVVISCVDGTTGVQYIGEGVAHQPVATSVLMVYAHQHVLVARLKLMEVILGAGTIEDLDNEVAGESYRPDITMNAMDEVVVGGAVSALGLHQHAQPGDGLVLVSSVNPVTSGVGDQLGVVRVIAGSGLGEPGQADPNGGWAAPVIAPLSPLALVQEL